MTAHVMLVVVVLPRYVKGYEVAGVELVSVTVTPVVAKLVPVILRVTGSYLRPVVGVIDVIAGLAITPPAINMAASAARRKYLRKLLLSKMTPVSFLTFVTFVTFITKTKLKSF